jgi:TetR/AcrR family transcriptional repressor of nem operon
MMGTLLLARVAGNGELSDEILAAGRETILSRAATAKPARKPPTPKPVARKAAARA